MNNEHKHWVFILKLSLFSIFLGRAWQHFMWDIPIRTLLWDQQIMEFPVQLFLNMNWEEYASSDLQDKSIAWIQYALGGLYFLCAVLTPFLNSSKKWMGKVILIGNFGLLTLALLYYKEKFFHLGQLLEYSVQLVTPILLYVLLYRKYTKNTFIFGAKVAIAFTFICHGLYAIGYYPQPGYFVDMIIQTLYVPEATARLLLQIMGILDIVISIGIFVPAIMKYSLYYAMAWGFLTAFVRVFANFYVEAAIQSLSHWLPEMLFRLSHGFLPLLLIFMHKKRFASQQKVRMSIRFMKRVSTQ